MPSALWRAWIWLHSLPHLIFPMAFERIFYVCICFMKQIVKRLVSFALKRNSLLEVLGICSQKHTLGIHPANFKQIENSDRNHCGNWLRGLDLNQRPSGYEPDELPGCSTPRQCYQCIAFYC